MVALGQACVTPEPHNLPPPLGSYYTDPRAPADPHCPQPSATRETKEFRWAIALMSFQQQRITDNFNSININESFKQYRQFHYGNGCREELKF